MQTHIHARTTDAHLPLRINRITRHARGAVKAGTVESTSMSNTMELLKRSLPLSSWLLATALYVRKKGYSLSPFLPLEW